jgi:hypothetical protein
MRNERNAMKFEVSTISILVVALAAATACSSSSSGASPAAADAGAEASDDDGGLIGPITELNDGAATMAPPIQCGSMTCSAPAGMVPLSPCCLPDNGCGATFGAAALMMFDAGNVDAGSLCLDTAPGVPDTSCPSQTTMGFTLLGCCAGSGVCGVDLSVAGLGCNSLSVFGAFAPPGDGSVSAPQACAVQADGGRADASTSRDGGSD